MEFENEERTKKVRDIIVKEIYTQSMDLMKRKIIEFDSDNKEELHKLITDYLYEISRNTFDNFVCENGYDMDREELANTLIFYFNNIYKYFLVEILKMKNVSNYISNLGENKGNAVLNSFIYMYPTFILNYLIEMPVTDGIRMVKISEMVIYYSNKFQEFTPIALAIINKYLKDNEKRKEEMIERERYLLLQAMISK